MRSVLCLKLSLCLAAIISIHSFGLTCAHSAEPKPAGEAAKKTEKKQTPASAVSWMTNYTKATKAAEQQGKMLFIHFYDPSTDSPSKRFEQETINDARVQRKLREYVCVKLPIDLKVELQGKEKKRIVLLEHDAFSEMLGRPGVAVIDYRAKAENPGAVISQFPLTEKLWYTPENMLVILDLPPGTLTQRTLIYAVRVHPDRPASADGQLLPLLREEATSHSQHQALIRLQGHHQWGSRFQRLLSLLPGGLTPREVCAESWPGERLVEAAIECVRCWRYSSGHWRAVSSPQRCFGYDMKLGDNGIWYATGVFGSERE